MTVFAHWKVSISFFKQFFSHVTFSGLNQYCCGGSFMCEAFAFCPLVLFVNFSFEIISLKKTWLL